MPDPGAEAKLDSGEAPAIRKRATRARMVSLSVIALLALVFLPLGVFLFTAKAFDIEIEPVEIADDADVRVDEGWAISFGNSVLLFSGEAQLRIVHAGFQDASVHVQKKFGAIGHPCDIAGLGRSARH